MCDCAEELERRERAKAEELDAAIASLRAQSGPGFFSRLSDFFGGLSCYGGGGGWLPFIGGAALLMGLVGYVFKNFGDKFNFKMNFAKKSKGDPCDGKSPEAPKSKPPPTPIVPCHCNS